MTQNCRKLKYDYTGTRHFHFNVIKIARKDKRKGIIWECKCDCGKIFYTPTYAINSGQKSCGCMERSRKYTGICSTKDRLYIEWRSMKQRCENSKYANYKAYGGRGIKVCEEWKNDFLAFRKWALDNGYRDDLSLDRIDVNGNYEPTNCRWADSFTQSNNRRNNHYLTLNGERHTAREWQDITGINATTIITRQSRGWSDERTLTTPIHKKNGGSGNNE